VFIMMAAARRGVQSAPDAKELAQLFDSMAACRAPAAVCGILSGARWA
jgi:hypothetical protein